MRIGDEHRGDHCDHPEQRPTQQSIDCERGEPTLELSDRKGHGLAVLGHVALSVKVRGGKRVIQGLVT